MDPFRGGGAPYPGLRPFRPDEAGLFFGRERQTDELLGKLQRHRFIAVTGPSGCGKSSLVKAGVIPAIRAGFMAQAGSRWCVCTMRPGQRPIASLAAALASPEILGGPGAGAAAYVEAALRFGPLGLVDAVREAPRFRTESLLVLVDQFEEIFRFRERIDPDEADAFVRLLLEGAGRPGLPIYVILTMRSDYLGDCALFQDLPEAISDSQYLTPRLTREECSAAIVGPARVFGGDVDPALVNRLLNDFGPDPDQLPPLQHALMRMWCIRREGAAPGAACTLTVEDYESKRIQGIGHALSLHGDEVLGALTTRQRRIAEVMFRRLTERATYRRDTRAPARLGEVAAIAQARLGEAIAGAEVAAVAAAFRGEGCNFITPDEGELEDGTLLDIGHESLIRHWSTCASWVDAEADSAAQYRRLLDTAKLWKQGEAAMWWNPDLAVALAWERRERPDPAWAARYSSAPEFAIAMEFLRASERHWEENQAEEERRRREERAREVELAQREAERQRLEAEAKAARAEVDRTRAEAEASRAARRGRALRRLAAVLGAALFLVVVAIVGHCYLYVWEHAACYKEYVKVYGVPRGLGPLTAGQLSHRPVSYRIVSRGRLGQALRMETVDGSGRLAAQRGLGTYVESGDAERTSVPVRWEFVYDDDGHVAYEVAYDRARRQVWSFVYAPADRDARRARSARFFGPGGYDREEEGSCASVVTFEYAGGYERRVRYGERNGAPAPGRDHAFGQERHFDERGNTTRLISLDRDGRPMDDLAGNAELRTRYDALGNVVEDAALDAAGAPTYFKDGWSRVKYLYDPYGNVSETAVFDEAGRPALHREGWHRRSSSRDARGQIVEERYRGVKGEPVLSEGCHALRVTYDRRGVQAGVLCLGVDDRPAPGMAGAPAIRQEYDGEGRLTSLAFVDPAGAPVVCAAGFHRKQLRYDAGGHEIEVSYQGPDGRPVTIDGHARLQREYGGWTGDGEIRRLYLGPDGRPSTLGRGYAEVRTEYARDGSFVQRYYDAEGRPAADAERPDVDGGGAYGERHVLDCGALREIWYLGPDGLRNAAERGFAGKRFERDALGRVVRTRYLAVNSKPATSRAEGIAGFASVYDRVGNEVERRYFGEEGQTVKDRQGLAGWKATYDRRGQETSRTEVRLEPAVAARP